MIQYMKAYVLVFIYENSLWNNKIFRTETHFNFIKLVIFFLWACKHHWLWNDNGIRTTQDRHITLFRSDQISRSVVSNSLRPHESQHARPPCPSPTPGVHSDSHPSSQWCHPAISSSLSPSPPAPNPSQHQSLFQWVNTLHEVAKVLEFQL